MLLLECLRSHQHRVWMILAATCMLRTSWWNMSVFPSVDSWPATPLAMFPVSHLWRDECARVYLRLPKTDDSMIQISNVGSYLGFAKAQFCRCFAHWQEIIGFFVAPFTGKYYFYLAADDEVFWHSRRNLDGDSSDIIYDSFPIERSQLQLESHHS